MAAQHRPWNSVRHRCFGFTMFSLLLLDFCILLPTFGKLSPLSLLYLLPFYNRGFVYACYYVIIWHYPRILAILGRKVTASHARSRVNNISLCRGLSLICARKHPIVQTRRQQALVGSGRDKSVCSFAGVLQ